MNDMASSEIAHTGKIVSMTPTVTTVEIISASACSSCHAAGLCGAADAVRKQIEVPTGEARGHAVGDVVDVVLAQTLGLKAVFISYVIPLFILLILAVSLSFAGMGELAAGGIALGGTLLYYGILYLFRDRISGEYAFHIKE